MRLVFMGTPDFAVPTLVEIVGRGHDVAAVYTRAPKPAGRGMEMQVTPVEREARRFGLPVLTPKTLRTDDALAEFRAHKADAAVVVAYGLILPKPVLDAVPLGCFNLHASLLPRWRGAAPINRAIMAGDATSGVMVMRMEEGLDTGPVAMAERVAIEADMTAGELHDALMRLGADLMVRALGALERGTLQLSAQPAAGVTYATKIDKSETRIDWARPWKVVHDHCRGLSPFPGAWFDLPGTQPARIKVLRSTRGEGAGSPGTVLDDRLTIACREGAVRLLEVQRAGRQPMPAEEFLRGAKLAPGTVLG
jgi:methionyl-tRNA formyltransferase